MGGESKFGGVSGQVGKEGMFLWHDRQEPPQFLVLAHEKNLLRDGDADALAGQQFLRSQPNLVFCPCWSRCILHMAPRKCRCHGDRHDITNFRLCLRAPITVCTSHDSLELHAREGNSLGLSSALIRPLSFAGERYSLYLAIYSINWWKSPGLNSVRRMDKARQVWRKSGLDFDLLILNVRSTDHG